MAELAEAWEDDETRAAVQRRVDDGVSLIVGSIGEMNFCGRVLEETFGTLDEDEGAEFDGGF